MWLGSQSTWHPQCPYTPTGPNAPLPAPDAPNAPYTPYQPPIYPLMAPTPLLAPQPLHSLPGLNTPWDPLHPLLATWHPYQPPIPPWCPYTSAGPQPLHFLPISNAPLTPPTPLPAPSHPLMPPMPIQPLPAPLYSQCPLHLCWPLSPYTHRHPSNAPITCLTPYASYLTPPIPLLVQASSGQQCYYCRSAWHVISLWIIYLW